MRKTSLCLSNGQVQKEILPSFGFEGSKLGVQDSTARPAFQMDVELHLAPRSRT